MNLNSDREWLKRKAEQEDGCVVSVGGLVTDLEQLESADSSVSEPQLNPKKGSHE